MVHRTHHLYLFFKNTEFGKLHVVIQYTIERDPNYFTIVFYGQCKYKDAVFTTLSSLLSNYCITVACFGHLLWPSSGFSEIIFMKWHECTLLYIPSKWWAVEFQFSYCIPLKQTIVASYCFVVCWCMFPPQSVRNLQQCKKWHTIAVSVGKRHVYLVTGPGSSVYWYPVPVGTKRRTCVHTQTDCACVWCRCGILSAGVEMILWLCISWANAWTRTEVADHQHQTRSWVTQQHGAGRQTCIGETDMKMVQWLWRWSFDIMDKDTSGWPSTSNTIMGDINSIVQADRHVLVKQLDLAFSTSHSRVWDIILECLSCKHRSGVLHLA